MDRNAAIQRLRAAWRDRRLTLYLGAGVSVANGLPTWERLVVAMYFDLISRHRLQGWRPFANYLYAIAEWHLGRVVEPLEITARRLIAAYDRPDKFLEHLHQTLYAGLRADGDAPFELPAPAKLRRANGTLDAVGALCTESSAKQGLAGVVSYNYDNLVEHVLGAHEPDGPRPPNRAGSKREPRATGSRRQAQGTDVQPVWNDRPIRAGACPIYHVHGYVPATGEGSEPGQLIFTEAQYHLASADPYAWPNLVQLNSFSATTGCMVGLSLSDPNMRRLLDAVMRTPGRTENFALLKRPRWPAPSDDAVDKIDQMARTYLDRFERSGVKSRAMNASGAGFLPSGVKSRRPGTGEKGPRYRVEIRSILRAVESIDAQQQTEVMSQLGIHPIWFEDYAEIPEILRQVTARRAAG